MKFRTALGTVFRRSKEVSWIVLHSDLTMIEQEGFFGVYFEIWLTITETNEEYGYAIENAMLGVLRRKSNAITNPANMSARRRT